MNTTVAVLSIGTLGVPAMLGAGLASSAHCALMCGALFASPQRTIDMSRLAGRLFAYTLIGALAGGAGGWILGATAWTEAGPVVRLLLLPPVIWLLLRSIRARRARACCPAASRSSTAPGHARRVAAGFGAAMLPCPLLLAAAGYAMLAGGAATGAALMLAFGVGTTPAVQAGAWMWTRAAALPIPGSAMWAGAAAAGLLAAAATPTLAGWCTGG